MSDSFAFQYEVGERVLYSDEGWGKAIIHTRYGIFTKDGAWVPVYVLCEDRPDTRKVFNYVVGEGDLRKRD